MKLSQKVKNQQLHRHVKQNFTTCTLSLDLKLTSKICNGLSVRLFQCMSTKNVSKSHVFLPRSGVFQLQV